MNSSSRERIEAAGVVVAEKRKALLSLLTPEERRTKRRVGSESAEGFEDAAAKLASRFGSDRAAAEGGADEDERIKAVWRALQDFQQAVNHLWVLAEEAGVGSRAVSAWLSKYRKKAKHVERVELEAEATFATRTAIARFEPGRAQFGTFAYPTIMEALDRYLAGTLSPVERPKQAERDGKANDFHEPMDVLEHPEPSPEEESFRG